MKKTLEQAIGCWTIIPMIEQSNRIKASAMRCKKHTINENMMLLRSDLLMLEKQIDTMKELVVDAIRRLNEIEATKELENETAS